MKGKKNLQIFAVMLVMTLLLSSSVLAWIPDQHVTQNREAKSQAQSSQITKEIDPYWDYFNACDLLTDISVVSYFDIDVEAGDSFWDKLIKALTFNIGKAYRATHSQRACQRALDTAETPKERACGYGICAHLVQDSVAHNEAVPMAIEKTNLWNGLLHSIKEIHDKDMMATHADFVYSRQVLSLGYELSGYFERVFVEDPALSKVSIPNLIDFFIKQVQPESEYQLGFRSFFALPSYIYWFMLIVLLMSLALVAFSIRKMIDREINILALFTMVVGLVFLVLMVLAFWGLYTGNLWSMWQNISQWLFSPAMYFVGVGMLLVAFVIIWRFFMSKQKMTLIPNLLVAIFLLITGVFMFSLPTSLETGNEQALHNKAVQQTVELLTQGSNYVKFVPDPSGYAALKAADDAGEVGRGFFMFAMVALLLTIIFFTFKPSKKKRKKGG